MSSGCRWFQEGWSAWCCQPPLRFLCSTKLSRPTLLPSVPPPFRLWLLALCLLYASTWPSILLLQAPFPLVLASPGQQMALRCLRSPARHVTLSRSLPRELSLPMSDVQVMGWQHSMALPVAVIDMPMFVAERARRERFRAGMQFSPDEPSTD